jgi:hypothetical protein
MALFLFIIIVAIALGILGVVLKGLFWPTWCSAASASAGAAAPA